MKQLLIIEDDPAILKALQASFEEDDYKIKTASNGTTGYEMALNPEIDLIILDLMLPGKNGKNICGELRNNNITTPMIKSLVL